MPLLLGRLTGAIALAIVATHPAYAAVDDYAFELVASEVRQSDGTVAVRLVHKPTGKAIPDAVIFARRLDMEPDGMPTMTSPLKVAPQIEPGLYLFKADLSMEGNWRLSLAAKVQGEPGTVTGRLIFKATP